MLTLNEALEVSKVSKWLDIDIPVSYDNKIEDVESVFDKIAGAVYQSLNTRFEDFRKGEAFHCLQRELKEETNIRCKLANFGLIRN